MPQSPLSNPTSNYPTSDTRLESSLKTIYLSLHAADDAPEEVDSFEQWLEEWNGQSQRIEEQLRFIESQLDGDQWQSPANIQLAIVGNPAESVYSD